MKCSYCDKESIDFVNPFPHLQTDKYNTYWCQDHKDNVRKLDDFDGQHGGYLVKNPDYKDTNA